MYTICINGIARVDAFEARSWTNIKGELLNGLFVKLIQTMPQKKIKVGEIAIKEPDVVFWALCFGEEAERLYKKARKNMNLYFTGHFINPRVDERRYGGSIVMIDKFYFFAELYTTRRERKTNVKFTQAPPVEGLEFDNIEVNVDDNFILEEDDPNDKT